MSIRTTIVKFLASSAAVTGLLGGAAGIAGANSVGNPSFEAPVVSGAVGFSGPATLGSCLVAPPTPLLTQCWTVMAGTPTVVHDDYSLFGVSIVPAHQHQFLWLPAATPVAGASVGDARVDQVVNLKITHRDGYRKFSLRYATMPTTVEGTQSLLHVRAVPCTQDMNVCLPQYALDAVLPSTSTGTPAAMGWRSFKSKVFVNADMGVLQVTLERVGSGDPASPQPAPGDPAVDAVSAG